MNLPAPGYFIYRDTPPGQPFDPVTPPVFFPPKDSDELFDALRNKYSFVKTHSERMRDAIIEFLLEERQAEQAQMTPSTSTQTAAASPWQSQSWPSMSSSGTMSTLSSPETLDLATPIFGMSPHPPAPRLSRQYSTAVSTTATSTEMSPPALEQMTGVFSLSSEQPKQRIRRKMTEAEKIEYRKRRIVKACDACQKRKRKCHHNQPEIETLAAKSRKVMKPRQSAQTTTKKPTMADPLPQETQATFMDFDDFNFDDSFANDMQLFDDFTTVFQDPVPEYGFDQHRQFNHLLGLGGNTGIGLPGVKTDQQLRWDDSLEGGLPERTNVDGVNGGIGNMQTTTGGRNLQTATSANNANTSEALKFDQLQVMLDGNMALKAGEYSRHLLSTMNTSLQGFPRTGKQPPTGNGVLWEHLRTGQVDPTHSSHVHDAEESGSYVFNSPLTRGQELDSYVSNQRHAGPGAQGPLEGMTIKDYLRMKTNFSNEEANSHASIQAPSIRRTQKEFGTIPVSGGAESEELPSTSVAGSSGSTSVAHEGRPMPTLGEGIARAASPSTELYMLKRRIPMAVHSVVVRNNASMNPLLQTETQSETHTSHPRNGRVLQANGGAYLRLDTENGRMIQANSGAYLTDKYTYTYRCPDAFNHCGSSAAAADQPVRSRPSNCSDDADQQHPSGGHSIRATATPEQAGAPRPDHNSTGKSIRIGLAPGANSHAPQGKDMESQSDEYDVRGQSLPYVHKKRDTFRRRDHFGPSTSTAATMAERESWREVASLVAVLGGLLLLASLLPAANANFALLTLALVGPAAGAKGTHMRDRAWCFWSTVWGTMLQCTVKNSSWLAMLQDSLGDAHGVVAKDKWQEGTWPEIIGRGGMGRKIGAVERLKGTG